MTKKEFSQFIQNKITLLDGGSGSFFLAHGMQHGICVEEWVYEHPEVLRKLQGAYVDAGSNIIYAPTFGANRKRLESFKKENEIKKLNTELVKLSKSIAGDRAFVAGNLSMTGMFIDPEEEDEFNALVDVYKEQISYLAEAGCDLLAVETLISLHDAKAAAIAAKEVCDLPVMITMSFDANHRTLFGDAPDEVAKVLTDLGVDAVGANCSTGPSDMLAVAEMMSSVTSIPIIAKPNAGKPQQHDDGPATYDLDEEAFAEGMKKMPEKGATILGGCCGTSPAYIKKLSGLFSTCQTGRRSM